MPSTDIFEENNEEIVPDGTLVRFLEWDEMADRYGYCEYDPKSIDVTFTFIKDMKPLCGKEFVISSSELWGKARRYHFLDEENFVVSEEYRLNIYKVSRQMFEIVEDIEKIPTSDLSFEDLF